MLVPLSVGSLDVLRRVQEISPLHWTFAGGVAEGGGGAESERGPLSPAERRECARAVEGFVQYHLGLIWDKGRFRRA